MLQLIDPCCPVSLYNQRCSWTMSEVSLVVFYCLKSELKPVFLTLISGYRHLTVFVLEVGLSYIMTTTVEMTGVEFTTGFMSHSCSAESFPLYSFGMNCVAFWLRVCTKKQVNTGTKSGTCKILRAGVWITCSCGNVQSSATGRKSTQKGQV